MSVCVCVYVCVRLQRVTRREKRREERKQKKRSAYVSKNGRLTTKSAFLLSFFFFSLSDVFRVLSSNELKRKKKERYAATRTTNVSF